MKRELKVSAQLVFGSTGDYSVLVGEKIVARKGWFLLPKDADVVAAVRHALETDGLP